jgi:uncharacterized protein (DUF362 family)
VVRSPRSIEPRVDLEARPGGPDGGDAARSEVRGRCPVWGSMVGNRVPPSSPIVAVESTAADVDAAVGRAMEAVRWREILPSGGDVALKVNLGWDLFIPGSITSPLFIEAVVKIIRPHVGQIYVVESDQVLEDIELACHRAGVDRLCRRHGLTWVNMSRAPVVRVHNSENHVLSHIDVPEILTRTTLVTLPVMKTHAKSVITGALKNQWGCISKMRHEYHLVLDDALADVNAVMRPALAVMDGTVGLEGSGPKNGSPRVADLVLCSGDPVALDATQARLMGFDPTTIGHLQRCAARGIGVADTDRISVVSSAPIPPMQPFLPAQHNAVSWVEEFLRRSQLKRLVFNSPAFRVALWGAKAYYYGWAAARGAEAWDRISAHPQYGPQWRALERPWPIGPRPVAAPTSRVATS